MSLSSANHFSQGRSKDASRLRDLIEDPSVKEGIQYHISVMLFLNNRRGQTLHQIMNLLLEERGNPV